MAGISGVESRGRRSLASEQALSSGLMRPQSYRYGFTPEGWAGFGG